MLNTPKDEKRAGRTEKTQPAKRRRQEGQSKA